MRTIGTKIVKLAELCENLFVRQSLNHDHVLALAELIQAGAKTHSLIEVTEIDGVMTIVDGRHRKQAFELNNILDVEVKVLKFDSEEEIIAYAFKANTGGSLPPSTDDIEHTVRMLLERKVPRKSIAKMLGLPEELGEKYVKIVQSKIARAKLHRAAAAVVDDGLSAPKAAETYGVNLDVLRQLLSGHKKQGKTTVVQKKAALKKGLRAFSSKQGTLIKNLMK